MKTKTVTKQRNQERSFETAMQDYSTEYDSVLDDSIIDELAMSEIEDYD